MSLTDLDGNWCSLSSRMSLDELCFMFNQKRSSLLLRTQPNENQVQTGDKRQIVYIIWSCALCAIVSKWRFRPLSLIVEAEITSDDSSESGVRMMR